MNRVADSTGMYVFADGDALVVTHGTRALALFTVRYATGKPEALAGMMKFAQGACGVKELRVEGPAHHLVHSWRVSR